VTGPRPLPGRRARPKALVPGKRARMIPSDVQELAAAREEFEAAKRRLTNVTRRIERRLGDAELGTIGDTVVLRREQTRTARRYLPVHYRDDIRMLPLDHRGPV
jgi:hypothetical protein